MPPRATPKPISKPSRTEVESYPPRAPSHRPQLQFGTMAEVQMPSPAFSPHLPQLGIRLPPIQPVQSHMMSVYPCPPASGLYRPPSPGSSTSTSSTVHTSSAFGHYYPSSQSVPTRSIESVASLSPTSTSAYSSPSISGPRGRKRSYDDAAMARDHGLRQPLPSSLAISPNSADFFPQATSEQAHYSSVSTPSATSSSFPGLSNPTLHPRDHSEGSMAANHTRCKLHIRQQPRAARAGPDGRDRRSLDPPPVVQLLIDDFDPESSDDVAELRSFFYVVHCRLLSPRDSPRRDVSTMAKVADDGSREVQRLLLGTAVSSPFFCQDDPDPPTAVEHPQTAPRRSPSPTDIIVRKKKVDPTALPTTVFIFADLSVRKAGDYRLEFSLMKMDPAALALRGSTVPIVHAVTSQVFKVVNAKDFDQVQPSTDLVKGLLDRGAGFPLKLKKGIREGQRRRDTTDGSEGDDQDDEEDD